MSTSKCGCESHGPRCKGTTCECTKIPLMCYKHVIERALRPTHVLLGVCCKRCGKYRAVPQMRCDCRSRGAQ